MKVTNTYDHFYRYDEVTQVLKAYEQAYPGLVRLSSLNVTKEGRNIWLLEVTDLSTGDFATKPAYFLNGHVHAGEVTGSMSCLHVLDYILTNSDTPEVAEMLTKTTFYVIPRPVPDGAERYLTSPITLRSLNEFYPFPEPMPGVQPYDLDGDGVIRLMLVKSDYGVWKKDAQDDRVMVKRLPDDMGGTYYNIFTEGLVQDYDGVDLQPAPERFGLDLNRNFPMGWMPASVQQGAGNYPLDRLESRTLAEFVFAHKNICDAITFHTFSGLYLYPPGMKPKREADPDDMERYEVITRIAQEETGFAPMNIKDDFLGSEHGRATMGSFEDFLHFGCGIYCYTVETWDPGTRAGIRLAFPNQFEIDEEEKIGNVRKILKWVEDNGLLDYYKPWEKFDHPQLGEVEIGGLNVKYVIQNAPPMFLKEEGERHTRFVMRHVKTMPHVHIDDVKVTPVTGNAYKVEALISNKGYMPTYVLNEYKKLNMAKEIRVTLSGPATFVTGKAVENIGHLEGFSAIKSDYFYSGIMTRPYPPCVKQVTWVVQAEPSAELTLSVWSERAGQAEARVTLP